MCADLRARGRPAAQRGLTMIELIMFIIIVSIGIAGILTVMNVTVKSSADPVVRKQSIAMMEAILEEVMTKDYTPNGTYPQPGANTCPDRSLADDVDDYANCNGSAYIGGTSTLGASTIAALANFKATVDVATTTLNTITMKKVTVTVTDPSGSTYSLAGYKANYY